MRNYRRTIVIVIFSLVPFILSRAVYAQQGDLSLNDADAVVMALSGQTVHEEGKGRAFVIAGKSNKVKITGDCKSITVTGSENEIELDRVGAINLTGHANHATYLSGLDMLEPAVSNIGADNKALSDTPKRRAANPSKGRDPKRRSIRI